MTGGSLWILCLHLCESHLPHIHLFSEDFSWPHLWPFKNPRCPYHSFSPFTSLGCTALYTLTSGSPGRGVAVSFSYITPQCWAHWKCSASGERRTSSHPVFPKPFSLLSVCLHPHSLPRIPPEGHCHLSKIMTILKRKGGDVKSKVKGLSGIWESKPNESNFMFNNSQHNRVQTCGLINWFVFKPLYKAVSRRPTGWPYIMCALASCCGSLLLTS